MPDEGDNDGHYVVVILDLDSDNPGVDETFGPLNYYAADSLAADLCEQRELERGVHVQVSLMSRAANRII